MNPISLVDDSGNELGSTALSLHFYGESPYLSHFILFSRSAGNWKEVMASLRAE